MAKKSRKKATKRTTKKANVSPIPKGYHTMTPGLALRNTAQAIEFYKKAFGAKEKSRMPGPDGQTIMHAELQIGDSKIMVGEEMPGMNPSPQTLNGSPVSLYLYVKDADKMFHQAVSAGATAAMPMMDQFWGDRAGMITDPFGHKWWLATHKRNLSGKEMKKAAEEFFAQQPRQQ